MPSFDSTFGTIGSAMNATQNLALYCASAVLEPFPTGDCTPPLPPPGERVANTRSTLTTLVEPWRKLSYINSWTINNFDEATKQAFASSMRIPAWDLRVPDFDPRSRSLVTVAAGPQFAIPPNHLPLPEDIQGVREWVYHLSLRTAERIMKLIHSNSRDWVLNLNPATKQSSHLYTTCAWGRRSYSASGTPSGITTHLLIVIQSPWTLGPADFELFCKRSAYRCRAKRFPKTGRVEVTQVDYVDKLWATIYDDCVRANTHYFVLTTYNQWAFGAFSRGWTTAWITTPKPYNSGSLEVPGPTILQSLLFWMHSAHQFFLSEASSAQDVQSKDSSPSPIRPSDGTSPSELAFPSETEDNTLEKEWLGEMRAHIKETKGLMSKFLGFFFHSRLIYAQAESEWLSRRDSWIIPEIWENTELPKPPSSKRTRSTEFDASDNRQHKLPRELDDEHVTVRRTSSHRRRGPSHLSLRPTANSGSSVSTHVFPGAFPTAARSGSPREAPMPVRISWTRAFMSMRSTLTDALGRLMRHRETAPPAAHTASSASDRTATDRFAMSEGLPEPIELAEDENDDLGDTPHPVTPPTTIRLESHAIRLASPRLMSGIHLVQPDDEHTWPPPRVNKWRLSGLEGSGGTEIDPDAQIRPEYGYLDDTRSIHANSIYEM